MKHKLFFVMSRNVSFCKLHENEPFTIHLLLPIILQYKVTLKTCGLSVTSRYFFAHARAGCPRPR